jgi:L-ascorbate metabolism protein UlaG (beta-lactamase superfamily)
MRITRPFAALAIVAMTFAGCSSAAPSAGTSVTKGGGLTIYYEENCQVEIIAPSGQRILIDVYDPTLLSSPATASDILLTTHLHTDHYNAAFVASFPGKTVTNEAGEFTLDGITIDSLDASHYDDTILSGGDTTDHIFVFDVDGFRIAHLGSVGQTHLTADQLAKLGKVDIAFAVLQDVSGQDATNTREIQIVNDLKPRLLIPTHTALAGVQAAGKEWSAQYSTNPSVTIAKDQLPASTSMLFMGQLAPSYGAILKAPETKW